VPEEDVRSELCRLDRGLDFGHGAEFYGFRA